MAQSGNITRTAGYRLSPSENVTNEKINLVAAGDTFRLDANSITSRELVEFTTVANMKAFDYTNVTDGTRFRCNGYHTANDQMFGPDVFWDANSTATDDGLSVFTPTGQGATGRLVRDFKEEINVYWGGAKGDNSTDDMSVFDAVAAKAISGGQAPVYIPEGRFVLSDKWTIGSPFDVVCERSASMRWTTEDADNSGILFDFEDASDSLCEIELPQLFSSAIGSDFSIPNNNAGANYNRPDASRIGSAVHVKGGNRLSIYVHYAVGWEDAVKFESSANSTCDNIDCRMNVCDWCVNGLHVYTGESGSLGFAQFHFHANTIWAKFPLYFNTEFGYVVASKFDITGGAIVNEDGGCVVYAKGRALRSSTINVNMANAGERSDSSPSTTSGLVCPFLGGDTPSNGSLYDGMGTSPNIGYFGGNHCDIEIGPYHDFIGTDLGSGSAIPAAGDTIRIRDGGRLNNVRIKYSDYETSTINDAITCSGTAGEANYNGGVGGAQYARNVYSHISVSGLAAGSSQWNYAYHQLASGSGFKPYFAAMKSETPIDNNIHMGCFQASGTNRQINIRTTNEGDSPFSGEIFFWLCTN